MTHIKDTTRLLLPISMAYVALLIVSNTIASKIILIGPYPIAAGILCFPLVYIINDVLTEVYGYRISRRIIWYGFFLLFIAVGLYQISISIPGAEFWIEREVLVGESAESVNMQLAFSTILGTTVRVAFASLLAYLVGSFLNAYVMSILKVKTSGRHLWIRTIGSTVVGESADSVIFAFVAFYGIFSTKEVLALALTGFILKTLYEILATPLTYYVCGIVKKIEGIDEFDREITYSPFRWN